MARPRRKSRQKRGGVKLREIPQKIWETIKKLPELYSATRKEAGKLKTYLTRRVKKSGILGRQYKEEALQEEELEKLQAEVESLKNAVKSKQELLRLAAEAAEVEQMRARYEERTAESEKLKAKVDRLGLEDALAPSKAADPSKKYVYIMRHGDRADDKAESPELMNNQHKYDPPLAPRCLDSVQRKIAHFNKFSLPKPVVISSPFLRCMQTALLLADGLECPHFKINIHKDLSEVLHHKVLKVPLEELVADQTFPNYQRVLFYYMQNYHKRPDILYSPTDRLPCLVVNDKNEVTGIREETRAIGGTADKRFRAAFRKHALSYLETNKALLIVTHNDALVSAVADFIPGKTMFSLDYCALLVFEYDESEKSFTNVPEFNHGVGIKDEDVTDHEVLQMLREKSAA